MCFLWLPSIALNSSSVSCSRFDGIGGGGIEYVGGAIKGIAGKKNGGGIPAADAKEGTEFAVVAVEDEVAGSEVTTAGGLTNLP